MLRATLRSLFAHKLRLVLSGVAVILGVAFVVGSLVLTDTLSNVFDHIFASADQKISVVVRGVKAPVGNGQELVPTSVLPRVRSVPGVAAAVGLRDGYAQLVDRHGHAYPSTAGPPALGISYDDNSLLSSVEFRSGHGPRAADEIAIDAATAAATGYRVGDRAPVLSLLPRTNYTIVGIFTVAGNANEAGASVVLFDPAQARLVMAEPSSFNEIDVAASPGQSDIELRDRIAAVLPAGTEAVTGATQATDSANEVKHGLSFFDTFLLVFAGVALFVGAFIIFNTFSMLVAGRQREVAVLRALGASRAQVLGAVLIEAGIVGVLAATIGIGLGLVIAVALRALVSHLGGGALPDGRLVLAPRTFVAAYLVGVLVTAAAAVIPARRSSHTPPVAALRGLQIGEISLRRSVLSGAALVALGVVALAIGLRVSLALVGVGAGLGFLGIVVLSPVAVPTVVGFLGAPLARRVPGSLGRRNAMRNPRRTSATAGALMVGLALVSAVSILAASVKTSTRVVINETFAADLDVQSSSGAGLTPSLAAELTRSPQIAEVDSLFFTNARVAGRAVAVTALPGRAIGRTVDVRRVAGSLALGPGRMLVSSDGARSDHLTVGELVPVRYPTGAAHSLRIIGIYDNNSLAGSYLVDASERRYLPGGLDDVVLVKAAPGVSVATVAAIARKIAAPYPNAKVQDRAQFIGSELDQLDALLNFITALLGLSIVIAVLGIVNTLALSVIERTRELGLLRAVGLSRRQLRRMIRSESVVVAVYGAVLGTAVGICFGIAITEALRRQGVTNLTLPFARMAVFVALAGLAGVVAAIWPARRAAHLDVLRAIAAE